MNANSLNYPATLVQGLLSSPNQGALHDEPFLDLPLTSRSHLPSRPPSLLVPNPHDARSYQQFHPQHQRQLSSASSIASTLSASPAHHMSARARPIPQAFLDDPAFSSDPDENPHFSMNSLGDFLPANAPALDVVSSLLLILRTLWNAKFHIFCFLFCAIACVYARQSISSPGPLLTRTVCCTAPAPEGPYLCLRPSAASICLSQSSEIPLTCLASSTSACSTVERHMGIQTF